MKQDRDTLGEISQYSWVRVDGPSDDGDIRLELVKKSSKIASELLT